MGKIEADGERQVQQCLYSSCVLSRFFLSFPMTVNSGLMKMNILKIKGLYIHLFCMLVFQLTLVFISGGGFGAQYLYLLLKLRSFLPVCKASLAPSAIN